MREITDDYMRQMMTMTKEFSIVILRKGPKYHEPETRAIVWEHGRRNFALRQEGLLSIVCPIRDDGDVAGIGIFNATVEETKKIMDGDPGVQAEVFVYEVHATRSFAGDSLPG